MSEFKAIKVLLLQRGELYAKSMVLSSRYDIATDVVHAMERAFSDDKSDEMAEKLFNAEVTAAQIKHEHQMVLINLNSINWDISGYVDREVERKGCQTDPSPRRKT